MNVIMDRRYVSYVTVLDMANQMHWYMPCHEWLKASLGNPEMLVVQPDTAWQWAYVSRCNFLLSPVSIQTQSLALRAFGWKPG